jgi:predicted RNase H-like HicB family nuclease
VSRWAGQSFGAWCPDLPGCVALGDTDEHVIAEMREAMSFHIAGMRADGEKIPPPSTIGSTVVDAA